MEQALERAERLTAEGQANILKYAGLVARWRGVLGRGRQLGYIKGVSKYEDTLAKLAEALDRCKAAYKMGELPGFSMQQFVSV
jgi:hypothetical protein